MHRCAVRHDGRYGHSYVPGVTLRVPHERGAYFLRTNRAGFRSDEEFGPRDGKPRVVVFGDSFAAGDGVANAERFTDRLARDLDVEVLNKAVSGSGPDQQLLLLEDHIDGCLNHAIASGQGQPYVDEVMTVVRRALGRRSARPKGPRA